MIQKWRCQPRYFIPPLQKVPPVQIGDNVFKLEEEIFKDSSKPPELLQPVLVPRDESSSLEPRVLVRIVHVARLGALSRQR